MRKHLLVDALLLVTLGQLSPATQAASLQTRENTILSVPAASIAARGAPGSTNLAGTNFLMSSVVPATSCGGSASLVSTRQWVRRFTNNIISLDRSASEVMAQRPDGTVAVAGYSASFASGFDFLTLCYAADGTPLWTNFYDGPGHGDDFASLIAANTNGYVWVAGQSMRDATNELATDVALLCYASNGISLWTNRYTSSSTNGDWPTGLLVDGSGNAYLEVNSAYWPPSGGGGRPVADTIVKFDPLGKPVWTNVFLEAAPDSGQAPHDAEAIGLDPAGNLFIAGMTGTETFHTGSAVLKLAGDGTPQWTNYHAISLLSLFRNVQCSSQGDVIVTGERFTIAGTNDLVQYVVAKYSGSRGIPLWTNTMLGPQYDGGDVPQTLVTPADAVLLVGGATGSPALGGLYQIMKFDSNGVPIWTNLNVNFGTNSEIYTAAADNAGELYLVAQAPDPTNSSSDYVTMKYSSTGLPLWTNFYDGPSGMEDDPSALVVNRMGEVFVTGESDNSLGIFESTTVAYADALIYTPSNNFVGLDTISYTLWNAFGDSAAGSVQVMVTSTNFELVPVGVGLTLTGFQLEAQGAPGTNMVIIQASTDLIHWQPLFTNAPVQGAVQYLDTSAPGFPHRYYRAEQLP